MNWDIVFFVNSVLLGVGLAMDAFTVSVANGLREPEMKAGRMCAIAGVFAAFQAVMPMAGWVCVHTVLQYFQAFQPFIPWIAMVLLLFIGGKMLIEGARGGGGEEGEAQRSRLAAGALALQGIATSIDALSVGFTIASYDWASAFACAAIVAAVTFVVCVAGLLIGRRFGVRFSSKAEILGGVILSGIGIEIFINGVILR